MEQVTKSFLYARVALLNRVLGLPEEQRTRQPDGTFKSTDSFGLDWAYGGVRLVRKGGSVDVSPRGTKRSVSEFIGGMLEGIEAAQRSNGKG